MSEHKLYNPVLFFRGIALRLPMLNKLASLNSESRNDSILLQGLSPEALLEGYEKETSNPEEPVYTGLQNSLALLNNSITKLSGKITGEKLMFLQVSSFANNTATSDSAISYNNVFSNTLNTLSNRHTVLGKEANNYLGSKDNYLHSNISSDTKNLSFIAGYRNRERLLSGTLEGSFSAEYLTKGGNVSSEYLAKGGDVSTLVMKNQENSNDQHSYTLNYLASVIHANKENKQRLVDQEINRSPQFIQTKAQTIPSHTIHQTFGDIIVQPANMDVSMQQLKVKIQDILKQARDTIY